MVNMIGSIVVVTNLVAVLNVVYSQDAVVSIVNALKSLTTSMQ